jgi:hypothetical protein
MKAIERTLGGLLLALLCAAAAAQSAPAAPAEDAATLQRRLQSVSTLIETSSAARQIDSSAEPKSLEHRSRARQLHRQAAAALAAGDTAAGSKLLDQAAREMIAGARLANPEQITEEKKRRDFDAREESVKALLVAQQRIVREKSAGRDAQEATRSVQAQLAQAQQLVRDSRIDEARKMLDRAYLTAKLSIESLRRGDTLVRSLNFASKREEFDYEVDRNDTHRMLVRVLLADRPAAQEAGRAALEEAGRLRAAADQAAARDAHEEAIKLLEESTRALVRAIRNAGVFIPG